MGLWNWLTGEPENVERLDEALKPFEGKQQKIKPKRYRDTYGEGIDDFVSLGDAFGVIGTEDLQSFKIFHKKYIDVAYQNELAKITEYRSISRYPEVAEVIEDAVNESSQIDSEGDLIKLEIVDEKLRNNDNIAKNIYEEFDKLFYKRIDLPKKIDDILSTYYTDGRVYLENVLDSSKPKSGIMNLKKLPTETMDFLYNPLTSRFEYFVQYMKQGAKLPINFEQAKTDPNLIAFYPSQITYIDYGQYGAGGRKDVLGFLEKVKQPYNQVKLLETSVVIYRLVRAPERLVFRIDVGNMPRDKAMKFVEKVKTKMQKRVTYDPSTGTMSNEPNVLSMLENFFLPQCLVLSTKISLLDGRDLMLSEIIEEFENGKTNWVYSVNQRSGEIIPGEIEWAGITRKNTEIIRIWLDNGEFIDCTPDHKFILKDGSEVEAQNLKKFDSLMPLYRKKEKINSRENSKDYEMIFDHSLDRWEFTHRKFSKKQKGHAIHHKNFNRFDNSPDNLQLLPVKDHIKLHSQMNHIRWEDESFRTKMSELKKEWWKNNKEYKKVISENQKESFNKKPEKREKLSILMKEKWNDDLFREKTLNVLKNKKSETTRRRVSEGTKRFYSTEKGQLRKKEISVERKKWWDSTDHELHYKKISEGVKKTYNSEHGKKIKEKISQQMSVKVNDKLANRLFVLWLENNNPTYGELTKLLENDLIFMSEWKMLNEKTPHVITDKLSNKVVGNVIKYGLGFKNYTDFKNNVIINHKVIKVERLDGLYDTGCLTIKDPGENHNFALSVGIFVKNSAEGRGSSIETIGGNPSGFSELDDLYYFQKKMYRALKYPLSRVESVQEKQSKEVLFSSSGGDIARDETKWGKFLKKHQDRFCDAFLDLFLLHLDFIGLKTQYEITKDTLKISMTTPNNYISLMHQNEVEQNWNNYRNSDGEEFSKYWRMKKFLKYTDEEINEIVEGRQKDKELGFTKGEEDMGKSW